ncbi:hypothetical protein OG203_13355 [Nocardia sp. NBC_01499]|uniref:hypothetical protein n=1 Tax=Nocardia sp. NBC_01499 TaxID=2903597 RepID=UPI0038680A30
MSAVAVAVIVGFVCCALLIRALGARVEDRQVQSMVVDNDQGHTWHGIGPGPFDA